MKIIFMGTPEFSLPTLQALHKKHQIIAVYTQAPKPAGRGKKETLSAVHKLANSLSLPVYTPRTLRKAEAQEEFSALGADCTVVIAYGLILPQEIIDATPYGCINIHPSDLPKYRGAAPMQRSILAGETETAMCIMQMDAGIDTGDVLSMEKVSLNDEITYPELSDNMAMLGAKNLIKVLDNIDTITPQKQSEINACYASKIIKEEAELNWNETAENLMRKIRVFNPWPGTFFYHNNEKIKVLSAKYDAASHDFKPGTIIDDQLLIVACAQGTFQPLIMQRPGKNPTATIDFLRGNKIEFSS
jgi:methionyl-tRNA formyltransferase